MTAVGRPGLGSPGHLRGGMRVQGLKGPRNEGTTLSTDRSGDREGAPEHKRNRVVLGM